MFDKWQIIDIIESKQNNMYIYNVTPIFDNNTSEIIKMNLQNKKWVMKLIISNVHNNQVYKDEIENIEKYELYNNPYFISMPIDSSFRSGMYRSYINGMYNNKCWYAMEKYDSNLKNSFLFGKNKMKLLISNIINTIEWLHLTKNRVHGDIKIDNILVNFNTIEKPFCLIDYETIAKPNFEKCIENLPNGYYFYALGCSSDKSFTSYRMDLEAFGNILWCLTLSIDKYYRFSWQILAFNYYENNKITSDFDNLNKLRNNETNIEMNDLVKSYFNIISDVDWCEENPNPDIYKRIKELI